MSELSHPPIHIVTVTLAGKGRAAVINEALNSAHWADKHIVIDTSGDDDNDTVEAIDEHVFDNCIVEQISWTNFGDMRTRAAALARQLSSEVLTPVWMVILDTDEWLLFGHDFRQELEEITAKSPHITSIRTFNEHRYYAKDRCIKIFPDGPLPVWKGLTHEYMDYPRGHSIVSSPWMFGEQSKSPDDCQRKFERDHDHLLEQIALAVPPHLTFDVGSARMGLKADGQLGRWYAYLVETYIHLENDDGAMRAAKVCAHIDVFSEEAAWSAYRIGHRIYNQHVNTGFTPEVLEQVRYWASLSLMRWAMLESAWLLGICAWHSGDKPLALSWARAAATFTNQPRGLWKELDAPKWVFDLILWTSDLPAEIASAKLMGERLGLRSEAPSILPAKPIAPAAPVVPLAQTLFVTAFIDIGRSEWGDEFARPNEFYFERFAELCKLQGPMVVFVEGKNYQRLLEIANRDGIHFQIVEQSDLQAFSAESLEAEERIMESEAYRYLIRKRNCHPQTFRPLYNAVNHCKVEFLLRASKFLDIPAEFLCWIDFGFVRGPSSLPKALTFDPSPELLSRKTTTLMSRFGSKLPNLTAHEIAAAGEVLIQGPFIFLHRSQAVPLFELYLQTLSMLHKYNVTDYDQTVFAQMALNFPFMFEVKKPSGWFTALNDFACPDVVVKHDLTKLWQHFGKTCSFVEVGVFRGAFSRHVMDTCHFGAYMGVDPYQHREGYNDCSNLEQTDFDRLYEEARALLGTGYRLIRKPSLIAAAELHQVDVVYIDGDHMFESVLADLRAWWPKVAPGGMMCGDDLVDDPAAPYDDAGNQRIDWGGGSWGEYGVDRALRVFEAEIGMTAKRLHQSKQWVLRKPL